MNSVTSGHRRRTTKPERGVREWPVRIRHYLQLVRSKGLQDKLALRAPGGWKVIEHENLAVFLPSRIQDRPPQSPYLALCRDTSDLWNKAGGGLAGRPMRNEISHTATGSGPILTSMSTNHSELAD